MKYHADYPTEPIGNGNPYYRCVYCKISDPEINGAIERHSISCFYRKFKIKFPEHAFTDKNVDSLLTYKRILTGKYLHYCNDWDFMILDETCPEFECCTCYSLGANDERP